MNFVTPERKLKAQNILTIIVISMVFGLVYNYRFYPHSFTEFLEAGSIGVILGLIVGILEEFVFFRFFQKRSFLIVSLIRTIVYSLFISLVLCLVLSIEISIIEEISYSGAVKNYLNSPLFIRDFQYSLIFILVIIFILQVVVLIGRKNFARLLLGLYHQPREVSRIFMFVDVKGSTSIAEKLGNEKYSAFVKDYFYDISDAVMMFGGEVYQYVGDEMIVVWRIGKDNLNCIKSYFKMKEILDLKQDAYLSKYDFIPEFKAGIHGGKVMITTVGKQKKELVYHGDVLNTTSRIEGQCNVLNQKLLISEHMLDYIKFKNDYNLEEKGEIELMGKSNKLRLYSITSNSRKI